MAYDISKIKESVNIADVIGTYIELRSDGNEFTALCPFHEERTPSFTVSPSARAFHCFGCGENGDVIDFVTKISGSSFKDACESLGGDKLPDGQPAIKKPAAKRVNYYEEYHPTETDNTITAGVPVDLTNPKRDGQLWRNAVPDMVHPYYDAAGNLHGYVLRIMMPDGKKITPQVRWCARGGNSGWTLHPFDDPKPLYGLRDLIGNKKQVVIVEGEKCRDYAANILQDKAVVVSWAGGTNGVDKVDWSPLNGRRVIYIPDNDDGGFKAMQYISDLKITEAEKYVIPDPELEKGWDIADSGMTEISQLSTWMKSHYGESLFRAPAIIKSDKKPANLPAEYIAPEQKNNDSFSMPFRILGHYGGTRFYMPDSTRQLVELDPAQHSKNNLLSLAPMEKWIDVYGDITTKAGLDFAVNGLLELSAQAGMFNSDKLRGRGAWLDQGRAIVHMGNRVYVDSVVMNPRDIKSNYVYQQDIDLGIKLSAPAHNADAHKLVSICQKLSWENSLSATLLAGWCVIAPLTGILPWRPHVWITGPSGAGKSTVLKSIISVMMGDIALKVEGKTTEAGIRQQLGIDARPVIFDEAEAEDAPSLARVKGILDFARVCSSGGSILKGGSGGGSVLYAARAAFCFSSINVAINQFADESRISLLTLKKDTVHDVGHYDVIEREIFDTITPEYADAMFSRSVENMESLQYNCGVFVEAANMHFKNRRTADQIGVLLAGAYMCHSANKIDRAEALEWISRNEWDDHTAINAKSDAERLMSRIASHRVRIQTDTGVLDITIGEAIISASHADPTAAYNLHSTVCLHELKRTGITIQGEDMIFANNSNPMRRILKDSPWESSWARTLSEFDGSEKLPTMYFSPGIKGRAVSVPIEFIM